MWYLINNFYVLAVSATADFVERHMHKKAMSAVNTWACGVRGIFMVTDMLGFTPPI
jgi:hypothetical protein